MFLSSIFYKPVRRGRASRDPHERPSVAPPDQTPRRPFLLDLVDRWGRR